MITLEYPTAEEYDYVFDKSNCTDIISFSLSPELKEKFTEQINKNGQNRSLILRTLVVRYLQETKNKKEK